MKKATITFVLTVLAFAASTALAQANFTLRADVPVAFSVHGRHYAAGSYELRAISPCIVRVTNTKTRDAGLFRIHLDDPGPGWNSAEPVLRFAVNGERVYLISLTDGDGNGWRFPVAANALKASRGAPSKNMLVALK